MSRQEQPNEHGPSGTGSSRILTAEQIERLLCEAEARLRAASEAFARPKQSSGDGDMIEIGVAAKRKPLPKLSNNLRNATYIKEKNGIAHADEEGLLEKQRTLSNILKEAEADQVSHPRKKKDGRPSSGPEWFDLPKTIMTPQLKRDLQIIEMRSVLDPHRHYKKTSGKDKVPTFSQMGTVIEGPTEWYSGRINKKDRANNFVEEALAVERESGRFKRKYNEIQEKKTSGKKAYYKSLMEKRRKRR